MKVQTNNPLDELLSSLRQYFQGGTISRQEVNEKTPLRSEIFSVEQMVQHAYHLAKTHKIDFNDPQELLLRRLAENEELLVHVAGILQDAVKQKMPIAPAGEWLLDNFYLIEEQIQLGKRYLPKGYSKGLPKIASGPLSGYPRVYDLAIEIISHNDGHLDIHNLKSFISAYQEVKELTLGELWAIPIMLRLSLLENLRRVAASVALDRIDADLAHQWADQIISTAENDPKNLILKLADMARSNPPMSGAFVAEFYRKIQWRGSGLTLPISWMEQQLSENGHTINSAVLAENQEQASDQVSITNSINSLRFLAKLDWREFVEDVSVVEKTLREDIDQTYGRMDFFSRDRYRHRIEEIARRCDHSENEVARMAISLARDNAVKEPNNTRKSHVGYFLIGEGKRDLEKKVKKKFAFDDVLKYGFSQRSVQFFYVFGLIAITSLTTWFLLTESGFTTENIFSYLIFLVIAALCSSYLATALVNWVVTMLARPQQLSKMDFENGIPDEAKTLVAVPTLLSSESQAERLIEDLEVRFLANRDKNLVFALLTDFKDSKHEFLPEDDTLLAFVENKIKGLNEKYERPSDDTFFLFHRPRRLNKKEGVWMGYERKRGKLEELNSLLRGHGADRFSSIIGDPASYAGVKYVITLDTDTQLPREAAWKLVGIMEHPLNQPHIDPKNKIITDGYAIIQPRIAISLHGATRSLFSLMHENDSGIDPYTKVTSDVYQDVFSEGSFIGKGIYHVDSFEAVLKDRFPENRILSHDLLEGVYARCGFASDVQFYEQYPSTYNADISRRHRWIRGDWQIGNWVFPAVPGKSGFKKNPINALSRWKIFDNLRRSLIPVAFLALLVLGWTVLEAPAFWSVVVASIILFPPMVMAAWHSLRKPKEIPLSRHLRNVSRDASKSMLQSLFSIACLPYEAFVSLHAIIRTEWRLLISRRRLLEWNPSGFVQNNFENIGKTYRRMWASSVIAAATCIFIILYYPENIFPALPFIVLWFVAPYVVWSISKPIPSNRTQLNASQRLYLRELSRKTWAFFEALVGPEDNWLPPDNLQQYPIPVVAHRTSPTNIGLSLLANLAAYDFGYIPTSRFIERTTNTFHTIRKLERYAGHLYNWYDTQSLKVLAPRYISTVDSGNFAGHLLTLRQGLLAHPLEKIVDDKFKQGLQDTIRLAFNALGKKEQEPFLEFMRHVEEMNQIHSNSLIQTLNYLNDIHERYQVMAATIPTLPGSEAALWIKSIGEQIERFRAEVMLFEPWMTLQRSMPSSLEIELPEIPTLKELSDINKTLPARLKTRAAQDAELREWLIKNQNLLDHLSQYASERISQLTLLADLCFELADVAYDFLYDKAQKLLTIGYTVDNHHRDASYYDLLASEARLASFVAIAQGKIPQESWFSLGRRLTPAGSTATLLSWSGSMFEYLMPILVMPSYENTLLDETYRGTVIKQIEFGAQHGIPWGVSESCYNVVDAHLTYQYRAFGIPQLGFKRGLDKDIVIAPYATVMGLMVDPAISCENLERMKNLGYEGKYGFYEAVDFTPSRLPRSKSPVLIQTFMAHHEGMSLLSLDYLLNDQPMQKRFSADPQFQTALLLLQERVPKTTGLSPGSMNSEEVIHPTPEGETRVITKASTPIPEVQLLSNGKLNVMVTHTGGGYSKWKDLALTRWREDTTRDHWGTFAYIRSISTGEFWSATHQPTLKEADYYEAIFSQGRAEFKRRDHEIDTHTEIIVSPEDDIEIRRVKLTNLSSVAQKIEVTSYGEVVIAPPTADASHPAFSNLFVQTEILEHQKAILCSRRARSHDETSPWMFHLMKVIDHQESTVSFETDRYKFIGRGRTLAHPKALDKHEALSGTQGPVLDPIVSIRQYVELKPGDTAVVDIITGIADSRQATQALIDKYQDRHLRDRAFELSWTHSQVVLRQINATEAQAQLYNKLASSVIYAHPALRATPEVLMKNQRGQSALWSYSISGDFPIILLMVSATTHIDMAKQLIQAHTYWQLKGLIADLVILNEDPTGYRQVLQEEIQHLLTGNAGIVSGERRGNVYVRSVDQISNEDYILFQTVARVILSDSRGTLSDQLQRTLKRKKLPLLSPAKRKWTSTKKDIINADLIFFNGVGGFSKDGKEYVINVGQDNNTPLPWSNVLANKNFGTIVTESGSSYTWAENAHEYRLTPWSNDPVTDQSGEAFYLRDEETGHYWSPTPWPAKSKSSYVARHGFGYSTFEHHEDGIFTQLTIYVSLEDSIKFTSITIKNESGRQRKISLTCYTEWVLGALRPQTGMFVVTSVDPSSKAILAHNAYNTEFQNLVSFLHTDEKVFTFTCDRREFIGRNRTMQHPASLKRQFLSGKIGAGMDPCAAMMVPIDMEAGQEREVIFKIGTGKDVHEAKAMIQRFKGTENAVRVRKSVQAFWNDTLSNIQIETPDQALNILTNGWLMYQVLSCRFWGRSGFYQSGGAYGFRDQLQDVLALMHADPSITREHILLSASRQFSEGDVQHWWHPPSNRGVRTMCSDDFVWLPYVTSRYVSLTNDTGVLQEIIPFIDGRPLNQHEESYYDLPVVSPKRASLYEHCKLAIQRALRFGAHGLPLIGSGDWNDGMNMVGIEGKGESSWLGFFVYDVLTRFQTIARLQNDPVFEQECETQANKLKVNLNKNAWDGNWYLRAYFDDGTPLGTSANEECRIDSISQSWSVLSGAGEKEKSITAMHSADRFLVNREKSLIQLLNPPFDKSALEPGYIKGYVPGVRENGGQYTHAAIWLTMAWTKLGDAQKAWELINMINPINHGTSAEAIDVYKVEPYVIAADVYGASPHNGRGGWTWYTGSAGWMYQLIVESFLGLKKEGNTLRLEPCVPPTWKSFKLRYVFNNTVYHFQIEQTDDEPSSIVFDDSTLPELIIPLVDDAKEHQVRVFLKPVEAESAMKVGN